MMGFYSPKMMGFLFPPPTVSVSRFVTFDGRFVQTWSTHEFALHNALNESQKGCHIVRWFCLVPRLVLFAPIRSGNPGSPILNKSDIAPRWASGKSCSNICGHIVRMYPVEDITTARFPENVYFAASIGNTQIIRPDFAAADTR